MRLVHLADYGGPYSGSFIPMLVAAISAARGKGWECQAVFSEQAARRGWIDSFAHQTEVVPQFIPSSSTAAATAALSELLEGGDGPTVLHTHFTAFDLAAVSLARRARDTYVFWHLHSQLHRRPDTVLRNVFRFAVVGRRVSAMLCVSPDLAARARRRLARRAVFFPNAIDTGRFSLPSPADRRSARERFGLPQDARVLLHFGWDWRRKGGSEYLHAIQRLLERERDVLALTVGSGEPARALARELGILESVRVLDPTEDVASLYAAADVFVSPARAEGTPFALAEALCSGLSAVVSPLAGHEFIGGEIDSCHLCERDPRAIASAISDLLARDQEQAAAQAEAAHAWISEHLALGQWAERLMGLYETATAR